MREILFRGKRVDTNEWVEGYYAISPTDSKSYIYAKDSHEMDIAEDGFHVAYRLIQVFPTTVGQYTGLTDKNGLTKIFEYDIIDANGRKAGNYYENSNLLKDGTCLLVARMGTKEWSRSEQEAIKRGCKYAE